MSKYVHFFIACLLLAATGSNAQSRLVHYWNFNKNTTANIHINNLKADYSLLDTNKAVIALMPFPGTVADTGYMDNYLPTALALDTPNINMNARMNTVAGVAVRVRNPSDSMELRFYIPSTGYRNLVLKFMNEASSATSGQKYLMYDYSTDSGSTWKTTALSRTTDTTNSTTFYLKTVAFSDSLDAAVKNNAKLVFRMKFSGQNTGTSGNTRFDNVTVDGDTIPVIIPVQKVPLHYWSFNKNTTANIKLNYLKADYSKLDTNKVMMVLQKFPGTVADTGYIDNYLPTALALDTPNINMNARLNTPAGVAVRVRNPSDSMELRFYIPSTGYQNLTFKFMSEASSATSGQKYLVYDYSTDSGTTWKTTALSRTMDTTDATTFFLKTINFSDNLDTAVKNNAKLVFRIKFSGQNTGSSGNSRFDNVTVDGDTLTANAHTGISVAAKQSQLKVYPNPAYSSLSIATAAEGNKTVLVVNSAGQKVYLASHGEKNITLNVSNWSAGIYFVLVSNPDGTTDRSEFIKQ